MSKDYYKDFMGAEVTSQTPGELRWFKGKLQQKWAISSSRSGLRTEWRDVPEATEEKQDVA